jgi:hypothetical protein
LNTVPMKQITTLLTLFCILSISVAEVHAQTSMNLVVTPSSPVFDSNHVVGVPGDAAPGYPFGSFASDGVDKTDMYFTPESLFFGRTVTLGEVASLSYWTKTGATHSVDPRDWYLTIYTKRYTGQLGASFYGTRIGTEPYFSGNIIDPANTWNQWTTNGPNNQLRFFESTYGYFGSYTDPYWPTFITGTSLAGSRGPGVPYATQPILFFSVQTGSAWAAGFTGQLDGFRIVLMDGSVANINFEPFVVAASKDACKNGGWMTLHRADGSSFNNQGDCIQYVNTGK